MKIKEHRKFPILVRIIAAILIITFIAQDIAWAYPDKLAAHSFFQEKNSRKSASGIFLEHLIENQPAFESNISLAAIAHILELPRIKDWCAANNITYICEETVSGQKAEILISDSPGNRVLRYYDPALSAADKYPNKIEEKTLRNISRQVLKIPSGRPEPRRASSSGTPQSAKPPASTEVPASRDGAKPLLHWSSLLSQAILGSGAVILGLYYGLDPVVAGLLSYPFYFPLLFDILVAGLPALKESLPPANFLTGKASEILKDEIEEYGWRVSVVEPETMPGAIEEFDMGKGVVRINRDVFKSSFLIRRRLRALYRHAVTEARHIKRARFVRELCGRLAEYSGGIIPLKPVTALPALAATILNPTWRQRLPALVGYALEKSGKFKTQYLKLASVFMAIEGIAYAAKFVLYPAGGALLRISPAIGVGIIILTTLAGGMMREIAAVYFKLRYPELPLKRVFLLTWIPYWVGFSISLPAQMMNKSIKELLAMIHLARRIDLTIDFTDLSEYIKIHLKARSIQMADEILGFQDRQKEAFGGKIAKIRSASYETKNIIDALEKEQPLVFIDTAEKYGELRARLRQVSREYGLDRLYVIRADRVLGLLKKGAIVETLFTRQWLDTHTPQVSLRVPRHLAEIVDKIIDYKRRELKEILEIRGHLGIRTEMDLSKALREEVEERETLLINVRLQTDMGSGYSIEREAPLADKLMYKQEVAVQTREGKRIISEGQTDARVAWGDLIRFILWEKGFHGEDKGISFDTYRIPFYKHTYLFRKGPLVDLPAYLRALIREKLSNEGIKDEGRVLLETERALELIAEWFMERYHGNDYGIGLIGLYVGLPTREIVNYRHALAKKGERDLKAVLRRFDGGARQSASGKTPNNQSPANEINLAFYIWAAATLFWPFYKIFPRLKASSVDKNKAWPLKVVDTHDEIMDLLRECNSKGLVPKVINFDSHHDKWPFNRKVDEGNWARAAKEAGLVKDVETVFPGSSELFPDLSYWKGPIVISICLDFFSLRNIKDIFYGTVFHRPPEMLNEIIERQVISVLKRIDPERTQVVLPIVVSISDRYLAQEADRDYIKSAVDLLNKNFKEFVVDRETFETGARQSASGAVSYTTTDVALKRTLKKLLGDFRKLESLFDEKMKEGSDKVSVKSQTSDIIDGLRKEISTLENIKLPAYFNKKARPALDAALAHARRAIERANEGNDAAAENSLIAAVGEISAVWKPLRNTRLYDERRLLSFKLEPKREKVGKKAWKTVVSLPHGTYKTIKGEAAKNIQPVEYNSLYQARRSVYEEINSELGEYQWLTGCISGGIRAKGVIEVLSDMQGDIRFASKRILVGRSRYPQPDLGDRTPSMIKEISKIIALLDRVKVSEKEFARICLNGILDDLEAGRTNRAFVWIGFSREYFETRKNEIEAIIGNIKTGRQEALKIYTNKANERLVSCLQRAISKPNATAAIIRSLLFRNIKIGDSITDPEFIITYEPEYQSIRDSLWGAHRSKAGPFAVRRILERAKRSTNDMKLIYSFVNEFINRYEKWCMDGHPADFREYVFDNLFEEWSKANGLIRGSPTLWWMRFYQAVFVPLETPAFKAISHLIETEDQGNFEEKIALINTIAKDFKVPPEEIHYLYEALIRKDFQKKMIRKEAEFRARHMSREQTKKDEEYIKEKLLYHPRVAGKDVKTILCYWNFKDELSTRSLIRALLEAGKRVVLPVPNKDGSMSLCEITPKDLDEDNLGTGLFNTAVPMGVVNIVPKEAVDLIIAPGRAFTLAGDRLGRGGGYFNRFLNSYKEAGLITPYTIGIGYDFQIYKELPATSFDMPVNEVVVPRKSLPDLAELRKQFNGNIEEVTLPDIVRYAGLLLNNAGFLLEEGRLEEGRQKATEALSVCDYDNNIITQKALKTAEEFYEKYYFEHLQSRLNGLLQQAKALLYKEPLTGPGAMPRKQPFDNESLSRFMIEIELKTPGSKPEPGSEEKRLLKFTFKEFKKMMDWPELTWEDVVEFASRANSEWARLKSARRLNINSADKTVEITFGGALLTPEVAIPESAAPASANGAILEGATLEIKTPPSVMEADSGSVSEGAASPNDTIGEAPFYWLKRQGYDDILNSGRVRLYSVSNSESLFKIHHDKFDAVSEIFFHLIDNSYKYGKDKDIIVRAERRDAGLHLEVEDRGIGIPKESMAFIGTIGYRAQNAKNTTTDGEGLGLATVNMLVERLHGTVKIESKEDKWTRVTVDLPDVIIEPKVYRQSASGVAPKGPTPQSTVGSVPETASRLEHMADDFEADLDNIMKKPDFEWTEDSLKHSNNVISGFKAFVGRDWDKLYAAIPDKLKSDKKITREGYFAMLKEAHAMYEGLTPVARAQLRLAIIFHDLCLKADEKDTSSRRKREAEYVKGLLIEKGCPEEAARGVYRIKELYGITDDIGFSFLPRDAEGLPEYLRNQLVLMSCINLVDTKRGNQFTPEIFHDDIEALSPDNINRLLADENLFEYRFRNMLTPRFIVTNDLPRMSDEQFARLDSMPAMEIIKREWGRHIVISNFIFWRDLAKKDFDGFLRSIEEAAFKSQDVVKAAGAERTELKIINGAIEVYPVKPPDTEMVTADAIEGARLEIHADRVSPDRMAPHDENGRTALSVLAYIFTALIVAAAGYLLAKPWGTVLKIEGIMAIIYLQGPRLIEYINTLRKEKEEKRRERYERKRQATDIVEEISRGKTDDQPGELIIDPRDFKKQEPWFDPNNFKNIRNIDPNLLITRVPPKSPALQSSVPQESVKPSDEIKERTGEQDSLAKTDSFRGYLNVLVVPTGDKDRDKIASRREAKDKLLSMLEGMKGLFDKVFEDNAENRKIVERLVELMKDKTPAGRDFRSIALRLLGVMTRGEQIGGVIKEIESVKAEDALAVLAPRVISALKDKRSEERYRGSDGVTRQSASGVSPNEPSPKSTIATVRGVFDDMVSTGLFVALTGGFIILSTLELITVEVVVIIALYVSRAVDWLEGEAVLARAFLRKFTPHGKRMSVAIKEIVDIAAKEKELLPAEAEIARLVLEGKLDKKKGAARLTACSLSYPAAIVFLTDIERSLNKNEDENENRDSDHFRSGPGGRASASGMAPKGPSPQDKKAKRIFKADAEAEIRFLHTEIHKLEAMFITIISYQLPFQIPRREFQDASKNIAVLERKLPLLKTKIKVLNRNIEKFRTKYQGRRLGRHDINPALMKVDIEALKKKIPEPGSVPEGAVPQEAKPNRDTTTEGRQSASGVSPNEPSPKSTKPTYAKKPIDVIAEEYLIRFLRNKGISGLSIQVADKTQNLAADEYKVSLASIVELDRKTGKYSLDVHIGYANPELNKIFAQFRNPPRREGGVLPIVDLRKRIAGAIYHEGYHIGLVRFHFNYYPKETDGTTEKAAAESRRSASGAEDNGEEKTGPSQDALPVKGLSEENIFDLEKRLTCLDTLDALELEMAQLTRGLKYYRRIQHNASPEARKDVLKQDVKIGKLKREIDRLTNDVKGKLALLETIDRGIFRLYAFDFAYEKIEKLLQAPSLDPDLRDRLVRFYEYVTLKSEASKSLPSGTVKKGRQSASGVSPNDTSPDISGAEGKSEEKTEQSLLIAKRLELYKKLILETRDECKGITMCKGHSVELARRLIKDGIDVKIMTATFEKEEHFWVEATVENDPYVLDAFPEGMGGKWVKSAKRFGDSRFIITKKTSDVAKKLYQGEIDPKATKEAQLDAADDIAFYERELGEISKQLNEMILDFSLAGVSEEAMNRHKIVMALRNRLAVINERLEKIKSVNRDAVPGSAAYEAKGSERGTETRRSASGAAKRTESYPLTESEIKRLKAFIETLVWEARIGIAHGNRDVALKSIGTLRTPKFEHKRLARSAQEAIAYINDILTSPDRMARLKEPDFLDRDTLKEQETKPQSRKEAEKPRIISLEKFLSLIAGFPENEKEKWLTLTAREIDVLILISQGDMPKEAAETLSCSKRTVDGHLDKIYRKLGVSNREQLVRKVEESRFLVKVEEKQEAKENTGQGIVILRSEQKIALDLVLAGKTYKQIAETLRVSPKKVREHLRKIIHRFRKAGFMISDRRGLCLASNDATIRCAEPEAGTRQSASGAYQNGPSPDTQNTQAGYRLLDKHGNLIRIFNRLSEKEFQKIEEGTIDDFKLTSSGMLSIGGNSNWLTFGDDYANRKVSFDVCKINGGKAIIKTVRVYDKTGKDVIDSVTPFIFLDEDGKSLDCYICMYIPDRLTNERFGKILGYRLDDNCSIALSKNEYYNFSHWGYYEGRKIDVVIQDGKKGFIIYGKDGVSVEREIPPGDIKLTEFGSIAHGRYDNIQDVSGKIVGLPPDFTEQIDAAVTVQNAIGSLPEGDRSLAIEILKAFDLMDDHSSDPIGEVVEKLSEEKIYVKPAEVSRIFNLIKAAMVGGVFNKDARQSASGVYQNGPFPLKKFEVGRKVRDERDVYSDGMIKEITPKGRVRVEYKWAKVNTELGLRKIENPITLEYLAGEAQKKLDIIGAETVTTNDEIVMPQGTGITGQVSEKRVKSVKRGVSRGEIKRLRALIETLVREAKMGIARGDRDIASKSIETLKSPKFSHGELAPLAQQAITYMNKILNSQDIKERLEEPDFLRSYTLEEQGIENEDAIPESAAPEIKADRVSPSTMAPNKAPNKKKIAGKGGDELTDEEIEVLRLILRGKSYKEAGKILNVSERVIDKSLQRVCKKWFVHGRRNLWDEAIKRGYIGEAVYAIPKSGRQSASGMKNNETSVSPSTPIYKVKTIMADGQWVGEIALPHEEILRVLMETSLRKRRPFSLEDLIEIHKASVVSGYISGLTEDKIRKYFKDVVGQGWVAPTASGDRQGLYMVTAEGSIAYFRLFEETNHTEDGAKDLKLDHLKNSKFSEKDKKRIESLAERFGWRTLLRVSSWMPFYSEDKLDLNKWTDEEFDQYFPEALAFHFEHQKFGDVDNAAKVAVESLTLVKPYLIHSRQDVRKVLQDLCQLYAFEDTHRYARELLYEEGLPALIELFGEDLSLYWDSIVRLGVHTQGSSTVYEKLLDFKKVWGEEFFGELPHLLQLAFKETEAHYAVSLFNQAIPDIQKLLGKDFVQAWPYIREQGLKVKGSPFWFYYYGGGIADVKAYIKDRRNGETLEAFIERTGKKERIESDKEMAASKEAGAISDEFKRILGNGTKRVLLMHNVDEGIGDELIRNGLLIQALLELNPKLEIDVFTNRPFLYKHPRINVHDIERTIYIMNKNYQMVINRVDENESKRDKAIEETMAAYIKQERPPILLESHLSHDDKEYSLIRVGAHEIKPSKYRETQYDPTVELLQLFGLPMPAMDHPKAGNFMLTPTKDSHEQKLAKYWWSINVDERNSFERPVLYLNLFGGELGGKGFKKEEVGKAVKAVELLIESGFFVVLQKTHRGALWSIMSTFGHEKSTEELLEAGLPADYRCYMAWAPDTGSNKTINKYLMHYSDLISTVEGGVTHLAYHLGKPYVSAGFVGMRHYDSLDQWIPIGTNAFQRSVPEKYDIADATIALAKDMRLFSKPAAGETAAANGEMSQTPPDGGARQSASGAAPKLEAIKIVRYESDNPRFREAVPSIAKAIQRIEKTIKYQNFIPPDINETLANPEVIVLLATISDGEKDALTEDNIVGYLTALPLGETDLYIERVGVEEHFSGIGIGRKMLAQIFANGYSNFRLDADDKSLQRVYRNVAADLGYEMEIKDLEQGIKRMTIHKRKDGIAVLRNSLDREIAVSAANLQNTVKSYNMDESSPKALILYADSLLEAGAAVDMEETIKKSGIFNNSTIIIYGQKNNNAAILERIIKNANNSIKVICLESPDLVAKYNTRYEESKELDGLIRFARAKGIINGSLLGVIKGPTEDVCLNEVKYVASRHKTPVVSIESEEGVYSFSQALNIMLRIKNEDGLKNNAWFRILPPITKMSEEIRKAYEDYIRALRELQTKA